ncbi:MAG: site-specific DNA-methyltransferase, partial [Bacteroidales bacterium]|nr:site-specific DNA-methyltransferase [Bacteroidales bacterium]
MPTLNWIGKDKIVNHHNDVPFRVLDEKYSFGEPSDNMIIHGDNLEALKALLPKYENRIKCIYIDPPYNTGNEHWVYNDNVNDPHIQKWLHDTFHESGITVDDLTRHDKWLCMMYPRLVLLQKLLSNDGAIFISIDDNEQANLKLMCDEIFGANNFVGNVIWEKKYSPQNDARWFSDSHDFVLVYAKNKDIWRPFLLPRTEEMNNRYKNPDNDPRGEWKTADFSVRTYNANCDYPITLPSGRVVNPPTSRAWVTNKEKFAELVSDNRIWFGKNGDSIPQVKKFLSEVKQGITTLTIWKYTEVGHNQDAKKEIKEIFVNSETPFDTPKPTQLIKRILQIASSKDSIILDSFAGSGTTAHAVLNLNKQDGGNRKFILVEMCDYAENITAERVRRVISGYGDNEGTGGGFSFYELGAEVFDSKTGLLNNDADIEKIREYIWFSETHSPIPTTVETSQGASLQSSQNPYLLGTYNYA